MYAKVIPKQLGILAEEFGEWGDAYPFIPEKHRELADDFDSSKAPNPNEIGRRMNRLNASKESGNP